MSPDAKRPTAALTADRSLRALSAGMPMYPGASALEPPRPGLTPLSAGQDLAAPSRVTTVASFSCRRSIKDHPS